MVKESLDVRDSTSCYYTELGNFNNPGQISCYTTTDLVTVIIWGRYDADTTKWLTMIVQTGWYNLLLKQ